MRTEFRPIRFVAVGLVLVAALAVMPAEGQAYGGPGTVISGVGALVAVVAAVVAAVFGFLWFPIKRMARALGRARRKRGEGAGGSPAEGAAEG